MNSRFIDCSSHCANDSDSDADWKDEGATPLSPPPAWNYGISTAVPLSVGYKIDTCKAAGPKTAPMSDSASSSDLARISERPAVIVAETGTTSANDPNIGDLPAQTPFQPVGGYRAALSDVEVDTPSAACFLIAPSLDPRTQQSLPAVPIAMPQEVAAPSLPAAVAGEPIHVQRAPATRRWNTPATGVRILYAALIPAVIAVNVSYESIRNAGRDLIRVTEGFTTLQQQVAEINKRTALPALTPTAPQQAQPILGPLSGSFPTPLPDRGSSPPLTAEHRKILPVDTEAPDPAAKSGTAKDEIPEPGQFVLATDEKKPAVHVPTADVPPANEFKLIGDN